ncbi:glycosyltransferase family A protein [Candidatus Pelagibacter sp.]|nr:glycosyltransferase family A protein [Candidatus Pelagibacter sp.]
MKKKLSLIVPALSTDPYIEDIIVNILNWTILPSQIVIVNSSDKDYRIENDLKKRLKKKKIKLTMINKKNLFPGAARNAGILKSSNEYIAFLDVNTLPYSRDWLKINFDYMIKNNLDGIFGKTYYSTNSYIENIIRASTYGKAYLRTIPGSIFKRKLVLSSVGVFNSESRAGEDTDWLKRVQKTNLKTADCKIPVYYKGLYNSTFSSIIKKWIRNYFYSENLPHLTAQKNFYLFFLFFIGFLFVFNWNYSSLCILNSECIKQTNKIIVIPHVTKIFLFLSVMIYTIARGVYLPLKKKIKLNFIFPINFLLITIFSFILDLVKTMTFLSLSFLKILRLIK